jgi:hypothetical protein
MTRSLLVLLVLTTASTTPRACSQDLDEIDEIEESPEGGTPTGKITGVPAQVTGGVPPTDDALPPGALTAQVPSEWVDHATALGSAAGADAALAAFTAGGASVCPVLRTIALDDGDLSRRGRAIQALATVADPCSEDALLELHRVRSLPMLVRTWAAAGRVSKARSIDELIPLASLVSEFPALQRPVGMRAEALLDGDVSAGHLVALSIDVSTLASSVLPILRQRPASELAAVMLEDARDPVRRQAAGYLGSLIREDATRADGVVGAYAFKKGAKKPLWSGGALYVPAAGWSQEQARDLYRNLLSWQIFCEEEGLDGEKRQIGNNLRSVGIWRVAGWSQYTTDTSTAVKNYGRDAGAEAHRTLLADHGLEGDSRYSLPRQVTR